MDLLASQASVVCHLVQLLEPLHSVHHLALQQDPLHSVHNLALHQAQPMVTAQAFQATSVENLASLSLRDSVETLASLSQVDSKLLKDTALQLTLLRPILLDGVMIMPMLESNSRPSLSLKLMMLSISLKMLVSQLTVILTATQSRLKKRPRKKILRLLTTSSLMLKPQKLVASKLVLKKLRRAIKIFLWILTVMV